MWFQRKKSALRIFFLCANMYRNMIKLPTFLFILTGSILAIGHAVSLKFFLYWQYLWLDIPMHTLGGMVVALGIFTIYDFRPNLPMRLLLPIPVLLLVILVALAWEVFELMIGIPIEANYGIDTAIDLIVGILGGVIGYILGYSFSALDLNEDIS
jgi:hypothetical protein